ncbi:MAG: hypothetical protein H0T66_07675 [Geodermatophilaceae bacterium]|nr:hypothetical protein [Geodermatophilaceae bacterium]MDQ3456934.1 hypothetical protein [Actinomycetota bacterium]
MRSHRTRRVGCAAALAATALTVAGLGPAAIAAPPAASAEAMVQYAVAPTSGTLDALAQRLIAAGYDVYGGGGGLLLVHGPGSLREALAGRTDVSIVREQQVSAARTAAPGDQDGVLPPRLHGNEYETFYGGYRTNDAFTTFLSDLQTAYPELVRVYDYGTSYTGANPLQVACVTANAAAGCQLTPNTNKTRFLLAGQIHARELTTSEIAWRELSYLTGGYGVDADVTGLLNLTEVWIAPQLNPDGVELVQDGITENGLGNGSDAWQRKNEHQRTSNCSGGSFSQIGVDLNRNFDSNFGGPGTSTNQCNLTYRGPSAASEPETAAVQDLLRDLFRDQRGPNPSDPAPRNTRGAMISMHSYSNLVLFPYGDQRHTPNDAGLRSMGFRMSNYNGYETGEPDEILYQVSGSTDDFAYEQLGIASFTYEIGPEFGSCSGFHPAYTCQETFWNLNRDALLYGMKAARQPYVMALGPTVTAASTDPLAGNPNLARVTATANDAAYGTRGVGRPAAQNVTAGRVVVGGIPRTMTVSGSGTSVTLQADIQRTASTQLVYIQGRDAAGNWGTPRAVWVPAL